MDNISLVGKGIMLLIVCMYASKMYDAAEVGNLCKTVQWGLLMLAVAVLGTTH